MFLGRSAIALKSLMVSINIPWNTLWASHMFILVSLGRCLPILAPVASETAKPVTQRFVMLDREERFPGRFVVNWMPIESQSGPSKSSDNVFSTGMCRCAKRDEANGTSIAPREIEVNTGRASCFADASVAGPGTSKNMVAHIDRHWIWGDCRNIWVNSDHSMVSPATQRRDSDVMPFINIAIGRRVGTPNRRIRSKRGVLPLKAGKNFVLTNMLLKLGSSSS